LSKQAFDETAREGAPRMPAFAKNPKFIAGLIVALWLAYIIYANFQVPPIPVKLFPGVILEFHVPLVMIASALFGIVATLVIQFFWRSSKNGSSPAAVKSKTVA
jgi:hypothetical protein